MVYKTWTNEPGKYFCSFSPVHMCCMHLGWGQQWHWSIRPHEARGPRMLLSALFFFKKKQGQFLTESGAYLQLDCMPTKLLRRASPTAAITQAAVLAYTTMPPSFLCECQGSELRASCFCSKHFTHWPMFLANQPMLKKELGLTQR